MGGEATEALAVAVAGSAEEHMAKRSKYAAEAWRLDKRERKRQQVDLSGRRAFEHSPDVHKLRMVSVEHRAAADIIIVADLASIGQRTS